MKRIYLICAFFLFALIFAYRPNVAGKEAPDKLEAQTILRLWAYAPPAVKETAILCPACGEGLVSTGVEEPRGVDVFNAMLEEKMRKLPACKFIMPDEKHRVGYALDIEENKKMVISLTRDLKADAILYPVLLRFRERVGNKYAASSPAAVAFHLHLIEPGSFKTIWDAVYSEEQQPLSENLLGAGKVFKRRVQWVTADRLIRDGLDVAFKSFPGCAGADQ